MTTVARRPGPFNDNYIIIIDDNRRSSPRTFSRFYERADSERQAAMTEIGGDEQDFMRRVAGCLEIGKNRSASTVGMLRGF